MKICFKLFNIPRMHAKHSSGSFESLSNNSELCNKLMDSMAV